MRGRCPLSIWVPEALTEVRPTVHPMTNNSRRAKQEKDLDKSKPFAIRRSNWENQVIADDDIPHKDMRTVMKFRQLMRSRTGTVILRHDEHEEEGLELLAKLRGQTAPTVQKCLKRL